MPLAQIDELLRTGYCGRVATYGADGWPYICPLLFVWLDGKIWFHNTSDNGHLKTNVLHDTRVCFEIDVPGQVFAYGRFACDTSIEYQSVIAFGHVAIETDSHLKSAFFDALMGKYYPHDSSRPRHFYPRLDMITLYSMVIARITGKHTSLPAVQDRWPQADLSKSPEAAPPT
jgi:uncharacterized protein